MISLKTCSDRIDLARLSKKVLASSNFNFAWQFYETDGANLRDAEHIRHLLKIIIEEPELHKFLVASFKDYYHEPFEIQPLHEHVTVAENGNVFEATLAVIAANVRGAYSPSYRPAKSAEIRAIGELFTGVAPHYRAYRLIPDSETECKQCSQFNDHWFSNWFAGVAWDWCFLVTWPEQNLLWIGCLTDTD